MIFFFKSVYPDAYTPQILLDCCFCAMTDPLPKNSWTFTHNFLDYPADKQTNERTNKEVDENITYVEEVL